MATASHPPTPQYPRRTPQRRWNPWLVRLPILVIFGLILLLFVLGMFLVALQIRFTDKVVPGVSALGIDLSGMTYEEAYASIANNFTYDTDAIFTFRDGDRFWQITAGELGVTFNAQATVDEAYAIGHERDAINNLLEQGTAWFAGESIAPIITYDESIALSKLSEIASELNQPAVDASLTLNGAQVIATDGQAGRNLDVGATLAQLQQRIVAFDAGTEIPLIVNETPPTIWNVTEAQEKARIALSAPVSLVAVDEVGNQLGPWTASVEQIAALLQITLNDNGDGTRSYDVSINMAVFSDFLQTLAPGLITPAQNGRFHFNESTGQLEVIVPSISGRELNIEETLARLQEGVFSADNRTVPMAFNYTLATYHNQVSAAELDIVQMVAESTTYFTGSETNRRTNIAVSASRFDGIIIGPGEEFSFNYHLGDISLENGFVDGKVIFGGRTVTGVGGGVCQVSTTAFRAAFEAGYAITERNSHGYRVGYYELNGNPPGLDAAIWQPERDFRFQNNTPYHLLIETAIYPQQNALQFRFYSTPHWQTEIEQAIVKNVEPAPPNRFIANSELQPGQISQVDYSADGADVTVYRNVYSPDGTLFREDFIYTHYLPWQAIYEVAPGDSRLNQNTG